MFAAIGWPPSPKICDGLFKYPGMTTGVDMDKSDIKVLLVEGSQTDARLVQDMLRESKSDEFVLTHVQSLAEALQQVVNGRYDVALLDLALPDANGLCSVTHLQSARPELPIVVLTGVNDQNIALQAVQTGAQDYLLKGQGDGHLLSRALWYAIERKERQAKLLFLAQYDQLTELPNRILFKDRLEGALKRAERTGAAVALMFIDLDRFKFINDTLGHEYGDQLLKAAGGRIRAAVRAQDTVARIGGDEFTVILEGITRPEDAAPVAEKVLALMGTPFKLGQHQVTVTTSIGIAVYPANASDPQELIHAADNAMYRVKARGRNSFQFFTAAMNSSVTGRGSLATSLRYALARNEFEIHYQPQVDLRSGDVVSLEALVRWRHPTMGLIPPARFLNLQEENGQIVAMGQWLLRSVCAQLMDWQKQGTGPLRVAVNLSARELKNPGLTTMLADILRYSGLSPYSLELEIAENVLREGDAAAVSTLFALKQIGLRLAVDDFGSSASSLRCLRRLHVDTLKIDRTLIGEVNDGDEEEMAVVDAIIAVGHHMDSQVVAKSVETTNQLAMLYAHGCDGAQGFLFSEALPADSVTLLRAEQSRWGYAQHLRRESSLSQ